MYYITAFDTIPKMDKIERELWWFTLDVVKPNAAGGSRGGVWQMGEAVPTWGPSLGPGDGEIILWCLDNHRVRGKSERERLKAQSCRGILDLKLFWLVSMRMDASIWRSWLFLMKEAYFEEKMDTFYYLIWVLVGWLWLRFSGLSLEGRSSSVCSSVKFQSLYYDQLKGLSGMYLPCCWTKMA